MALLTRNIFARTLIGTLPDSLCDGVLYLPYEPQVTVLGLLKLSVSQLPLRTTE
jgi:hypothetical protein